MADRSAAGAIRAPAKLRCAIYTRKSSEEGLEQDFNSLDAQREAREAFIASQKREGWSPVGETYDDGGFSGGTMERPAFRRLLKDVNAGRIDVVVVYKVDRLTRSLSDFAKIVEIFDQHGVSFVSVTQQFNTTSSMGRLTLNILLSFAQFEREVTGERIRDKIAASKKKGMWMGGLPSLGYDVKDRKLIVNEAEAETVRHIFRRYVELKSVRELKEDLDSASIASKVRTAPDGSPYGGQSLARGALYLMLQNRIHRGEIVHKVKSYPGEHKAIIDETLWNDVQAILSGNRVHRANGNSGKEPSLLTGILFDASGGRMSPTHATKKGLATGTTSPGHYWEHRRKPKPRASESLRLPLKLFLCAASATGLLTLPPSLSWSNMPLPTPQLKSDRAHINGVTKKVGPNEQPESETNNQVTTLSIPACLKRTGKEMRIVVTDGSEPATPDSGLVRLLVRANAIRDQLLADRSLTFEDIAEIEGVVPSYATRLFRPTVLAPDIVSAILNGRHPPELTARRLMDDTRLPLDWNEQRRCLGFASTV